MRLRERLLRLFRVKRAGVTCIVNAPMLTAEQVRRHIVPVIDKAMSGGLDTAVDEGDSCQPTREQTGMGKFEIFRDKAKQFRWRLRARNGRIVAQSEGYTREFDARRACKAVQAAADGARIAE